MAKKICGVYRIWSIVHSDRCYIGSARDILNKRWPQHRRDLAKNKHNYILQNHYNKYGIKDLVFEILEELPVDIDNDTLLDREDFFMRQFSYIDDIKPYFNVNPDPRNCKGAKHSPESNEAKSERLKGKKRKPFSKEHCENLSRSHKGKFIRRSQHYTKGQKSTFKGKKHTEEAKQKNREKHMGTSEKCKQGALTRKANGNAPERDEKGRFKKKRRF